jgi:hypothetical protein
LERLVAVNVDDVINWLAPGGTISRFRLLLNIVAAPASGNGSAEETVILGRYQKVNTPYWAGKH